jgi:hypothetical protein
LVSKVIIHGLGIIGPIPNFGLSDGAFVSLQHSYLSGTLPPKWSNANDVSIMVNNNQLSGKISFLHNREKVGKRIQ